MAKDKDNRVIKTGIPVGEHIYVEGEEDELEAELTPAQVEYLKSRGALEGDWTGRKEEDNSEEALKARFAAAGGRTVEQRMGQYHKAQQAAHAKVQEPKPEQQPAPEGQPEAQPAAPEQPSETPPDESEGGEAGRRHRRR
jgi:hypothetical protein